VPTVTESDEQPFSNMGHDPLGALNLQFMGERDFLRAVLDTAASLIVVLDMEGRVVRFNRACEEATGYASSEVLGKSIWDIILPVDELEHITVAFDELVAGNFPNTHENHWVARDGSKKLIAWSNTAILSRDGAVQFIVGTGIDITERRAFEAAQIRMAEHNRLLLESTSEGIIGVDRGGLCTFANRAAAEMTGYEAREMLGQDMHTLLHHSYEDGTPYPREACPIFGAFGQGDGCRRDTEVFWRRDGSSFPVQYTALPLIDAGQPSGAVLTFEDVTERRLAQNALKESELLFREMAENIDEVFWIGSLDFSKIFYVSPAYETVWGLSCQSVYKNPFSWAEIIHPEDRDRATSQLRHRGQSRSSVEYRIIRADGAVRWIQDGAAPIRNAAGEVYRMGGIAKDITERKQREMLLQEQADILRRITTEARCILWHAQVEDVGTPKLVWKLQLADAEAAQRVLPVEVRPGQTYEQAWYQNRIDEDRVRSDEYGERHVRLNESYTQEFRCLDKHGVLHNIREQVEVTPEGPGRWRATGVCTDVTEQTNTLRQLERDAAILSNVRDSVIVTDLNGVVTYWNDGAACLFGWSTEEMLGRPYADRFPEPARTHVAQNIKLFAEGLEWEEEWEDYRKDGSRVWIWFRMQTIRDVEGRPVAILGLSHDVGERRQLEQQLATSQKMEGVGRLAGGIAHDFNNLLTVILGYTEMASGLLPADLAVQSFLTNVLGAGRRAAELTEQLLAFARQQVMETKPLNTNRALIDVTKLLRRVIGEDIELVMLPTEGLWAVLADEGRLGQVLMNLAVNARDAMPDGGKLTIETMNVVLDEAYSHSHPEIIPGDYVLLKVSDNGVGMSKETTAHMFEPFFTTKEIGKGTGLGLATCYGIVRQHGGHIEVYSELGVGTTFSIYLPRSAAGVRGAPKASSKAAGGTETILLVEDEPGVRELAARALRTYGYTILEAENGLDALRVVGQHEGTIDLLLTDVVMPHMGGRVVAERLSAEIAGLKVLYASGYPDGAVVANGVLAPGLEFIQKPYTPSELARKVRAVLDGPG
jgi:two-component system cell cycle sensor histidine kinase/response regulator CckA